MTLRRLLLRATGPARLRSDLRRMTRPVRRYRGRFAALDAVHAHLPRAVMGGDLLDLLSDQLRSTIEDGQAQPAPIVDEGRRRSPLLPPLATPQAPGFPALPATSPAAARSMPPTDAAFAPLSQTWPDGASPNASRDLFRPVGDAAQSGVMGDIEHTRGTNRVPPGAMERDDAATRRVEAPDTALARSVRAYWRSERATSSGTNRAESGAAGRDERQQPTPSPDDKPAAAAARAWPEQTTHTLMERMASFVAGRTPSAGAGTPSNGAGSTSEDAAASRVVPSGGASTTGTTASSYDLSEQMADILREQATQHGIDLV